MTIIENTKIENNSKLDYNVCIIGSGMSGQIISSELINSKVLIVESGSLNFDEKIQSLNEITSVGMDFRKDHKNRIRQLGGSANLWANQLMMLNEFDLEKREWIDKKNFFPINYRELENYYNKVINKIYKKNFKNIDIFKRYNKKYYNNFFEEEFTKDDVFDFNNHFWPSKVEKFDIKSNFTMKLFDSKNVDLIQKFTVTDLEFKDDNESVDFIKIKSGKKEVIVKADLYILACGAIENARLLLNNQNKSKILKNENIGRYFMDHPRIKLGSITSKKKLPLNHLFGFKYSDYSIRRSISLTKNHMAEKNLLNSYAFINPQFDKNNEILFSEFLTFLKILIKQKKFTKLNFKNLNIKSIAEQIYLTIPPQISNNYLNNFLRMIFEKNKYNFSFNKMNIDYQGEQFPNYNSSIYLNDKTDCYNQKKSVINWQLSNMDYKTLDEFIKIFHDKFRNHEYLSFDENKNIEITDASHHIGTTRMSLNRSDGVIDHNCKFHDIKNLYIAGSSIYRISGSANPGFTNMAMSIRLGEHINNIL